MTEKEALKLSLEALKYPLNQSHENFNVDMAELLAHRAITAIKEALAQPEQEPVTVLPDGSAFAVMSYPLPKGHWLYAEREYRDGEDEPIELGKPILTHQLRDSVVSAVRYAVRGATNCGKEVDFDPDALVKNAVYALCGPYTSLVATSDTSQERVDKTAKQRHEQEPVVWMYQDKSTHQVSFQKHMKAFVDHSKTSEVPLYGKPLANHELQCVCGAVWCGDEMVHLPNKTPPQRTWVGLTDDEIDQGLLRSDYAFKTAEAWRAGVVFAMTKLKEKNT